MNEISHPPWCDAKRPVIGDVRYEKIEGEWTKHYYDGSRYIPEQHVKPQLVEASRRRKSMVEHAEQVRKTGFS